jgi:multidrug efflux pump subunit AcrA (membrane-fusion protein)
MVRLVLVGVREARLEVAVAELLVQRLPLRVGRLAVDERQARRVGQVLALLDPVDEHERLLALGGVLAEEFLDHLGLRGVARRLDQLAATLRARTVGPSPARTATSRSCRWWHRGGRNGHCRR